MSTKDDALTCGDLREIVTYDPSTGIFTWSARSERWFNSIHGQSVKSLCHGGQGTPRRICEDQMMIDVSKIRVGDEVTVRAKVVGVYNGPGIASHPVSVSIRSLSDDSSIVLSDIATHTPKPRDLKPGEYVTAGSNIKWRIEHVSGPFAWIVDNRGCNQLEATVNLRHADESE